MKNLLPATFLIIVTLLSACNNRDVIGPKAAGTDQTTTTTTPVNTSSDDYLPLAKGNTWNYNVTIFGVSQPVSFVVTDNTTTINGNIYTVTNGIAGGVSTPGYFSHNGSLYTERNISSDPQAIEDEPFLDDSKPAGSTYTLKGNDVGIFSGHPFRYLVTIKEKGIAYTAGSKTYQNVIHTHTEAQVDLGSGYVTSEAHDYYFAKGIGIIEVDDAVSTQILTSYTLK